MAKKRPLAPPASPTDEWGIYDPAKAGMEALYSRLGRPVLRAADEPDRRRRRRSSFRAERPADGVGMAIQEARRRANQMAEAQTAPPVNSAAPVTPAVPVAPAVPAVTVVHEVPEIAAAPAPAQVPAPSPAPIAAAAAAATAAPPAKKGRAKTAKSARRKPGAVLDAAGVPADRDGGRAANVPAPALDAPPKRAARGVRGRTIAKETPAPPVVAAAPAVPPPSPRRPRGPVPLAAWAHAVTDSPRAESRRTEAKGLWRGIFRIPSEVALVEYGRGCRIHRLVIEGGPDSVVDPF
ncbi:MAG: hypothetical protein AB7R67_23045 [Vicinamibacterales bacterium]